MATMAHAASPQTSSFQVVEAAFTVGPPVRIPRRQGRSSFAAIAVISTSAAAAAGILPRPVQSVVERAVQYVGWDLPERDVPAATTVENPEPTR